MKAYYSHYLATDYAFYPSPPYKGRGWIISFDKHVPSDAAFYGDMTINGKRYPPKAVIVHAASLGRAQYVADMIYAAQCLMSGELPPFGRTAAVPVESDSVEQDCNHYLKSTGPDCVLSSGLPLVCMIAARASHRRTYQYALFKYLLSHEVFSTSNINLDPSHWWPARFVFDYAEHHIRCAYAIVLTYSVLEELSLELRASQKKPSTIDGKWNPKVRNELETRLEKAGIDLSEPILWTLRDTPTRIERTRPPRIQSRAEWAGLKVRDSEVAIVDAVAYASWLRSKVSAHKLPELAQSLSYYNVANIQHLARRLLLERLGFWRHYEQVDEDNGS